MLPTPPRSEDQLAFDIQSCVSTLVIDDLRRRAAMVSKRLTVQHMGQPLEEAKAAMPRVREA